MNKSAEAAKIFSDINEAHETLSNEVKREIYDSTGLTSNEQYSMKQDKDDTKRTWTWKEVSPSFIRKNSLHLETANHQGHKRS